MFYPQEIQPSASIFDIELGDLKRIYTYDPQGPATPMSLSLVERGSMGLGEVTFTLFDDTGYDIEPYFWLSRDIEKNNAPIGRIRWGYSAQGEMKLSTWRNFQLIGYNVAVGRNSFTITGSGLLTSATLIGGCNAYSGTWHECIDKIAAKHNYKLQIVPPVDESKILVPDPSGNTTELRIPRFNKIATDTDLTFLKSLIPYAISADGKRGYTLSVNTENDQDTIRIQLPEYAQKVDNDYIVQDKNSVVLEWSPNIQFNGMAGFTTNQVVTNSYQHLTGDEQKEVYDYRLTKEMTSNLGKVMDSTDIIAYPRHSNPTRIKQICSECADDQVKNMGVRQHAGSSNPLRFESDLSRNIAMRLNGIHASLKVLGDPYLVPGKLINVIFYYPTSVRDSSGANNLHYTSGQYYIYEVTHEIINGTYTTKLDLGRMALSQSPTSR